MLLLVIEWILLIVKVSECVIVTCGGNDTATPTRVAKMCQSATVMEDEYDTSDEFNSVFLSLSKQEDNCSCDLSIKNATTYDFVNLHIKRLNNFTEQPLCGMEIDIYQYGPLDNRLVQKIPTRCDSPTNEKTLSLQPFENLQFISKVVDGNFSIGYCIQILREHKNGNENTFLEISCDSHELTSTMDTNPQTILKSTQANPQTTLSDTTTNLHTTSNDLKTTNQLTLIMPSSTSMVDKQHIQDKTDSDNDSILYIAVGSGGGCVILVSLLVVILVCKRRKSHHSGKEETTNQIANSTADDDDDDGLKYNVMYVSSERHDDIDVNYSTVDGVIPRHIGSDDEGDYNTVDDNKKIQDSSVNTRQFPNTDLEDKDEDGVEHSNAPTESCCVYAVVDKSRKRNNSVKKLETASTSAIYAVVDKNRVIHPDEVNKLSNKIKTRHSTSYK